MFRAARGGRRGGTAGGSGSSSGLQPAPQQVRVPVAASRRRGGRAVWWCEARESHGRRAAKPATLVRIQKRAAFPRVRRRSAGSGAGSLGLARRAVSSQPLAGSASAPSLEGKPALRRPTVATRFLTWGEERKGNNERIAQVEPTTVTKTERTPCRACSFLERQRRVRATRSVHRRGGGGCRLSLPSSACVTKPGRERLLSSVGPRTASANAKAGGRSAPGSPRAAGRLRCSHGLGRTARPPCARSIWQSRPARRRPAVGHLVRPRRGRTRSGPTTLEPGPRSRRGRPGLSHSSAGSAELVSSSRPASSPTATLCLPARAFPARPSQLAPLPPGSRCRASVLSGGPLRASQPSESLSNPERDSPSAVGGRSNPLGLRRGCRKHRVAPRLTHFCDEMS